MSKPAALVTGAGRGIGLAAALELARSGFSVAVNDRAEGDELSAAVDAVRAVGADCAAAPFDVTEIARHNDELEAIEQVIGPLTTLVNNAGIGVMKRGDPLEVTESSWDRCHSTNAKSMFFMCQAFAKRLLNRRRDGGLFFSIINVTSSNAVAVAEPRSEYSASKAAAAMVSKAFAVRLGRENIAVYDVQPGLIETDMTAPVIEEYRVRAKKGLTLMPRIGTPAEIGTIIASLASGKLPYTTGQAISADAGMLVPRF